MLYVTLSADDFDDIVREYREFEVKVHDVRPLAEDIAGIMATQNMAARMAGVDKDGYPFHELAESTWRRHPDRGFGPPLAGMETASRVISDFTTEVVMDGVGSAEVVGHWPSMDEFIIYHITGTKHMPQRNPAGITPSGWSAVADAFDRWMLDVAGVE